MKHLQGILVVIAVIGLSFTSCNNAQRDWPGDEDSVGKVTADTTRLSMNKAELKKLPASNVNRQSADSTETASKAR